MIDPSSNMEEDIKAARERGRLMKNGFYERVHAWWFGRCMRAYVFFIQWRNARARRKHRCLWRCYRDGGGGQLVTPKPMTEAYATAWVARIVGGEVFHVDFEHRMIFYRSRGG